MEDNSVLAEIRKISRRTSIPFGVSLIVLGLAFLPIAPQYPLWLKLTIPIILFILGACIIARALESEEGFLATPIRYVITLLLGVGIGIGITLLIYNLSNI